MAGLKKASSDLHLYSQQIKIKPSGVYGASVICAFLREGKEKKMAVDCCLVYCALSQENVCVHLLSSKRFTVTAHTVEQKYC